VTLVAAADPDFVLEVADTVTTTSSVVATLMAVTECQHHQQDPNVSGTEVLLHK
jgi:hypothetical protein